MKTFFALIALLSASTAFADCKDDFRRCARDCNWQHAACDIPNSPYCIGENRKCLASCDKEYSCSVKTGSSFYSEQRTPPANPHEDHAPAVQEDVKQEPQYQE